MYRKEGLTYEMYSFMQDRRKSKFENAFEDIRLKIDMYEKMYISTIELYITEYNKDTELDRRRIKEIRNEIKEEHKKLEVIQDENERYNQEGVACDGLRFELYCVEECLEYAKDHYTDFLDLYSKSIFVALYSLVESELRNLCEIAKTEFDKKITPSDLSTKGGYIAGFQKYLNLVIEIPEESLAPYFETIKPFNNVRNIVVHTASRGTESELQPHINSNKGLIALESGVIKIKNRKYVGSFLSAIRNLFEELAWQIDIKQGGKFLQEALSCWLSTKAAKVHVGNLAIERKIGKSAKINCDLTFAFIEEIICRCTISISYNRPQKKDYCKITDNTNNLEIAGRLEVAKGHEHFIFDHVISVFNFSAKKYLVELEVKLK